MSNFRRFTLIAVLLAVAGCTTHEVTRETVVEKQPQDKTVVVVPPSQ